jgi:hypothetical protein
MNAGVWPQRVDGRTLQKVRRGSWPAEAAEGFFRPISRDLAVRIVRSAEKVAAMTMRKRDKGRRWGVLSPIDVQVLRCLVFEAMDWGTGKLDWSYDQIMKATGRARDTVNRSLAALRRLGFLARMRRFEKIEGAEGAGPRVQQCTNAYQVFAPPPKVLALIGIRIDPPPLPDDVVWAQKAKQHDELAMELHTGKGLMAALNRLRDKLEERESRKRTDSPSQGKIQEG